MNGIRIKRAPDEVERGKHAPTALSSPTQATPAEPLATNTWSGFLLSDHNVLALMLLHVQLVDHLQISLPKMIVIPSCHAKLLAFVRKLHGVRPRIVVVSGDSAAHHEVLAAQHTDAGTDRWSWRL